MLTYAGKFDIYCVGMTAMRCLLPSFSSDPRPGMLTYADVC
jgi:hypothetical protein